MQKTIFGDKGGQIESFSIESCRHCDERGWVLFPWENRETRIDPKTIHVVHFVPGATRGNHSHPRVAEWLCPIEGEGLLTWRSPSGELQELHLEAQARCVRIRPGVPHAVTNVGPGELILIAARESDPAGDLSVPDKVV
ncbi:MAG: WxcM-like domain-containing protein [Candidatus Krumholzibacteria bacterium]|nr:WxcM-like domain-containing protein [Candidatus Krumholzibacteria bacterium]